MNVTTKYSMVFYNKHNDKTYYSISDSSKNVDGTYINRSWNIRFKGEAPTDRSKINVKDGFVSYYKPEDKVFETIQCMDWEYCETQPTQKTEEESSLPF